MNQNHFILGLLLALSCALPAESSKAQNQPQAIVCPSNAPAKVRLAANEIRRYLYLRTGKLLPVAESGQGIVLKTDPALGAEEYRIEAGTITGGSDLGVLYGAYRYAELLGVRFYLHGDVVPDEPLKELPPLNDAGKPLFETRGIQPFHDFQEGPDWWNQDDYLVYIAQLAKLRMNFIGLHCYPEGVVGPEPLVWIGTSNDIGEDGSVKFSYPAEWASTERHGMWGVASMKTGDYAGGARWLFADDTYAPDVMAGMVPRPKTPEECNELFNRIGRQMNTVFSAARQLGIKTCVGTETPLTIPKEVRERGTDVKALYTGIFKRIQLAMPVDYYWLWTPEDWTWRGNNEQQFAQTTRDIQAALDALRELGNPFTLATCGWVLGPAHDRGALDAFLPKSSPMSCINRNLGHEGVEPAFAAITGRLKWAIPWMENDPNMTGPQPWVGRMRYDAADARRFGCTGLLGIHWRTKAMAPNVSALAAAGWDQSWLPSTYDATPPKVSKSSDGAIGGSVARFQAPVAGAAVAGVYQSVRYGLRGYNLNIPNGTYTVTLQFNEPHYTEAGKRVFGAKIQGKQVLEHLDLFARAGANKALDLSFPEIAVTDSLLRIEFTKEVEFPCIAGIVITGSTAAANQIASEPFTRKINCGGDKAADYQADNASGGMLSSSPGGRSMPVEDFYEDFARANFGDPAPGKILARMDGRNLPEAGRWTNGPGGLTPNPKEPWAKAKERYSFVNDLERARSQIKGAGNLERFDYWLNTYRALAAMAEASCLRGQLDSAMAGKDFQKALAARVDLAKVWTRLIALQTSIVSTPGELGTIANLEQQTRRRMKFVEAHDAALATALGKPLPEEAQIGKEYDGPSKIIVPTVRTSVRKGEKMKLSVIVLANHDKQPARNAVLHFRQMGTGTWNERPLTHVGRAVYTVELPEVGEALEYRLTATTASNERLTWPATAPQINQTVVSFD